MKRCNKKYTGVASLRRMLVEKTGDPEAGKGADYVRLEAMLKG